MNTSMVIDLDIWKLLGLVFTLVSAFWGVIMLTVRQFNNSLSLRFDLLEKSRAESDTRSNDRFEQIEKSRAESDARSDARFLLLEATQKQSERNLLEMKAELPDKYVKREDAIRSETTLHAKFDGLANTIHAYLRGNKND